MQKIFKTTKKQIDYIEKGNVGVLLTNILRFLKMDINIKIDGPYKGSDGDGIFLIEVQEDDEGNK